MKISPTWIIPVALVACAAAAQTQSPSEPLIRQRFEESESGWTGMGQNAKTSVTHETSEVRQTKGALRFEYSIAKGEMNLMVLPTSEGSLAKAKSVKFWTKTDSTTPLVLVLQEQDEGRYVAIFNAPKGNWQQVELSTSDFVLAQDTNDPKDPDGKLEMEKVTSVGIGDLSQMFAQGDSALLSTLTNIKLGSHVLYLDDFTITTDSVPASASATAKEVRIDTFAHPELLWLSLGNVQLSRSSDKPLDGNGLKAAYHVAPGKMIAFTRMIAPGMLAGTERLSFDIASLNATKVLVQVEETDGGKYNTVLELPGGSELKHVSRAFSEFKAADDSKDTNDKLDLEKVKSVMFIDISGLLDQADLTNTLWIGKVGASKTE